LCFLLQNFLAFLIRHVTMMYHLIIYTYICTHIHTHTHIHTRARACTYIYKREYDTIIIYIYI